MRPGGETLPYVQHRTGGKTVKPYLQPTLFGLAILLGLSCLVVNAETSKTTTAEIRYNYYEVQDLGKEYYRFLPDPAPEGLYYQARMIATANIDDTPEKETIVLIGVATKPPRLFGPPPNNWRQVYLLITDNDVAVPKKKAFFKLFDSGIHDLEVSTTPIELHSPPFILKQPTNDAFRLVDVTGDGILDVWVETTYGVALISFENAKFKEVFGNYTITPQKLAETAEIEYHSYYDARSEPQGRMFHRFLGTPPPVIRDDPHQQRPGSYHTRMTATANIDDTPEKETIALIVVNTAEYLRWGQAFLLITENETGVLKKKDLFKLFDAGTYDLDVPGKTIEVQSVPFVFRKYRGGYPWGFPGVFFRLIDLTGDGILDLWVEHAYGVAVISFQKGEFKEVFSSYVVAMRLPEYVDLDNNGTYEIKIPSTIPIHIGPRSVQPEWVSLHEWNGSTYVLNNEKFYKNNNEIYKKLLIKYSSLKNVPYGQTVEVMEAYEFYLGLAHYYRGTPAMAKGYLQRVVQKAKNKDYIKAAKDILKKLPTN